MTDHLGSAAGALAARAIDPVCGTIVDPTRADQYVDGERTLYFCCSACLAAYSADPANYATAPKPAARAVDPVCGMEVDPACAEHYTDGNGTRYFCCAGCRTKYAADPARYSALRAVVETTVVAAPVDRPTYTCPMHPQVRQDRPGSCPFCGMALEPATISAAAPANDELADMQRRLVVAAALTVPVIVLAMGGHTASLDRHIPPNAAAWLEFAFATPVVAWAGRPFFERAWSSIVHRSLNMFSLIALGTGSAYLYSVVATTVPGIFPAGFRGPEGRLPSTSRPRPSSRCSYCWAKFSNYVRAHKPAPRFAPCCI